MSFPAFMYVNGETQGVITQGISAPEAAGGVHMEGCDDCLLVREFHHGIHTNLESGGSAGHRVHQEIRITKAFDRSSLLLYSALLNNENLPECWIRFYRFSPDGDMVKYLTITLTDAQVHRIETRMPDPVDGATHHLVNLEEVAFVYRKIAWDNEVDAISVEDDWGTS